MTNFLVRGVPLYSPRQEQQAGRGWVRTGDPRATLGSLRELSRWSEQVFGVGLGAASVDLLLWLQSAPIPPRLTAADVASRIDVPEAEASRLLQRLMAHGLLRAAADGACEPTPRLHEVLREMDERLDRSFVPREALHRALLVCDLRDRLLQDRVERLFDHFFDLGWLYLHNWASLCTMMATLVARVLAEEGLRTRVRLGRVSVARDGATYDVGAPGSCGAGQFDGHAYCVIGDDEAVVDFGLGVLRRGFRRDMPWAVAVQGARDGPVLATLEHPLAGRVRWFDDWQSPAGHRELEQAVPIADEMMGVYRAGRRAGGHS